MDSSFDPYHKWLGIRREDQPPHHYRLLGLDAFEDDPDVIANAADARMVHIKTFQAGKYSQLSQKLLNEIAAAKICLLHPDRKTSYDQWLREHLGSRDQSVSSAMAARARPQPSPPPPPPAAAQLTPPPPAEVDSPPPVGSVETGIGSFPMEGPPRYMSRVKRSSWKLPAAISLAVLLAVIGLGYLAARDGFRLFTETPEPPAVPPTSNSPREQSTEPALPAPIGGPHEETPAQISPQQPPPQQPLEEQSQQAQAPSEPVAPEENGSATADPPTEATGDPGTVELPRPPDAAGIDEPEPPSATSPPTGTDASSPPAVSPMPDAAALQAAEAEVRELFEAELAAAKTPPEKLKLAENLYRQAADTTADPVSRDALLQLSADLAATAGDVGWSFAAFRAMGEHQEPNTLERKADALEQVVSSIRQGEPTFATAHHVAYSAFDLIDEAIAGDRFTLADRLVQLALPAVRKARDRRLDRQLQSLQRAIERDRRQYEQMRHVLEQLGTSPDDAPANLEAGRWLAFSKGQWQRGLAMLANGSDTALADLARRDLASPDSADQQMQLADDWWTLAGEEEDRIVQSAMRGRATHWYESALPKLTGLSEAKAEKRIEEARAADERAGDSEEFALLFDGGMSHVMVPSFGAPDDGPLTVELYVVPADVSGTKTLIGNRQQSAGWSLSISGGFWEFNYCGQFTRSLLRSSTPAVQGQPVHLAAVVDDSRARLFVNGRLEQWGSVTHNPHVSSSQPLVIGAASTKPPRPAEFFAGLIAYVRISDCARYSESFSPPQRFVRDSSTRLLLALNEGSGLVARDLSGNACHGTIFGARWIPREQWDLGK